MNVDEFLRRQKRFRNVGAVSGFIVMGIMFGFIFVADKLSSGEFVLNSIWQIILFAIILIYTFVLIPCWIVSLYKLKKRLELVCPECHANLICVKNEDQITCPRCSKGSKKLTNAV
jgi:hypothetical protein